MTKRCPTCKRHLPLQAFGRDRSRADGRMNRCKECDNTRSRAYYEKHRDANRQRANARNAAQRAALPPKTCAECNSEIPRRHTYCGDCRTSKRPRRTRLATAHIDFYYCHRCNNTHVAGRCRIGKTIADLDAMTDDELTRWGSGAADYIWTADDWAIHTTATSMQITGFHALRLQDLRRHQ